MKILLLGGSGKVGRAIRAALDAAGLQRCYAAPTHRDLDLLDPLSLEIIRDANPSVIINAVALTNLERCDKYPDLAQSLNANVPRDLAILSRELGALLVHLSTDYVFNAWQTRSGNCAIDHIPLTEDAPVDPIGVYGRTKFDGEQAVRAADSKAVILRLSTIYDATLTGPLDPIRQARLRHDVSIMHQICTPTSASFVAKWILKVLRDYDPTSGGTYHLTPRGSTTRADFLRLMTTLIDVNLGSTRLFIPEFERPVYSVLDSTKFSRKFGEVGPWQNDAVLAAQALREALRYE